jgi:hypothetical protein
MKYLQTSLMLKTLSITAVAVVLSGCQLFQPTPHPMNPTGAIQSLYTPVASSASGLWWPLLFSGFLAIIAGVVNAVVFGRGHKLFLLGLTLAAIPPVTDHVMRQSSLIISLTVLSISIMLLVWVGGKWFGWKMFGKQLKPLADKVKDKSQNYTAEDALTIIEGASINRPKSLKSKIEGDIK